MLIRRGSVLVPFLALVALASIVAAGYFFLQTQQLQKEPVKNVPSSQSLTQDEVINWRTYTNSVYGYEVQYPANYSIKFCEDCRPPETAVNVENPNKEVSIDISDQQGSLCANNTLPCEPVKNLITTLNVKNALEVEEYYDKDSKKYLFSVWLEDNSRRLLRITGSYASANDTEIINQILSTFKFVSSQTGPPPATRLSYIVPATWKRVTTTNGLKLCLPPKWELDQQYSSTIVFNRDPGYKPQVTQIVDIPYAGGSRRQAYFDYWKSEYPEAEKLVNVTEVTINSASVLKITRSSHDKTKNSPDILAVVWLSNGKLWRANLDGWRLVNDSQSAFLKDFYTAISCSL